MVAGACSGRYLRLTNRSIIVVNDESDEFQLKHLRVS